MKIRRWRGEGPLTAAVLVGILAITTAMKIRPAKTDDGKPALTFTFKPAMKKVPPVGQPVSDAHIVRYHARNDLDRTPTRMDNMFLFGADHLFKVETSFNRTIPGPLIALRDSVLKPGHFEAPPDFFTPYGWSKSYRDKPGLLLFDKNRELVSFLQLVDGNTWRVEVTGSAPVPLGVFMRERKSVFKPAETSPLTLLINRSKGEGEAGGEPVIDVLLLNRSKQPIVLYAPDSFDEFLANNDAYFDIYGEKVEAWKSFKPPKRSGAVRSGYKKLQPGLSLSYEAVDLKKFYTLPKTPGEPLTTTFYVHCYEAGVPAAWTGLLVSNTIELILD